MRDTELTSIVNNVFALQPRAWHTDCIVCYDLRGISKDSKSTFQFVITAEFDGSYTVSKVIGTGDDIDTIKLMSYPTFNRARSEASLLYHNEAISLSTQNKHTQTHRDITPALKGYHWSHIANADQAPQLASSQYAFTA